MLITYDWLYEIGSPCGDGYYDDNKRSWNADQFALLGIKWPPKEGWMQHVVNASLPVIRAELIERLRGTREPERSTILGQYAKKNPQDKEFQRWLTLRKPTVMERGRRRPLV